MLDRLIAKRWDESGVPLVILEKTSTVAPMRPGGGINDLSRVVLSNNFHTLLVILVGYY